MTVELQAYGWRREGMVWHQVEPHLMLVHDAEPDRDDLDDIVVIRLMSTLHRTLRHPRGRPLRATTCDDCGGLLALTDLSCPVCLVWAERDAVAWSWSA